MTIPKAYIPYIVGVVILVGAGGFAAYRTIPKDTATETPAPEERKITASLKDLLNSGKTMRCTFSVEATGARTDGVTYVGDGRIRSDFEITVTESGKQFQSHLVIQDNVGYVWTSVNNQGYKVPIVKSADYVAGQQQVNIDQRVAYQCHSWQLDRMLFAPPSSMSFTDLLNKPTTTPPAKGE